jgi:hypothetical protein
VTAFAPGVEGGSVEILTVSGGITYLAGSFRSVGGALRSGLAAVDAAGQVTPWSSPMGPRDFFGALRVVE